MSPMHLRKIISSISEFKIPEFRVESDQLISNAEILFPLSNSSFLYNRAVLSGEYYSLEALSICTELQLKLELIKRQAINSRHKIAIRKEKVIELLSEKGNDLFSICVKINKELNASDRYYFISVQHVIETKKKQYVENSEFLSQRDEYQLFSSELDQLEDYSKLLNQIIINLTTAEGHNSLFNNLSTRLRSILHSQVEFNVDYNFEFKDFIFDDTKNIIELANRDRNQPDLFEAIYKINIALAYLDEILECDEGTKTVLMYYEKFLVAQSENKVTRELISLLLAKIEFLNYKIDWRYFKNSPNITKRPEEPKKVAYGKFYQLLLIHYERKFPKFETNNKVNQYTAIGFSDLHPFEVHNLIWYLKKGDHESLDSRIRKIILIQENLALKLDTNQDISDFNKISYQSSVVFCWNAVVELRLRKEKLDGYKSVLKDYVDVIAGKTTIDNRSTFLFSQLEACKMQPYDDKSNFYVYYTYAKFVEGFIEYLKDNPAVLYREVSEYVQEDQLNSILLRIKKVIWDIHAVSKNLLIELRKAISVAKQIELKPFYLTFDECTVPYVWSDEQEGRDTYNHVLFLNSGHILPNDITRIIKQIVHWEASLTSIDLEIVEHKLIIEQQKLLTNLRDKSLQIKIKEGEFRSIQIIALFVSVSAFVLSSTKMFETENTALENYGILIGFAGGLIMFNAGINFLVQWNLHRFRFDWKQLLVGILLLIGIIYSLRTSKAVLTTEYEKSMQVKEDKTKDSPSEKSLPLDSIK